MAAAGPAAEDGAQHLAPSAEGEAQQRATPVTVITGFLGAGKSTLLKHILTEKHGRRVAVLQNEMADAEAVAEQVTMQTEDGAKFDEWVELPNGCLCCSVRGKLVMALETLMERQGQFDYILVETTGTANPGALAASLWLDDELESRLQLDAIVTVVDAVNVLRHVDEESAPTAANEAVQQIAYADCLLLNKTDLVDGDHLARVERLLGTINGTAPVHRCSHSRIDLGKILDLGAFDTTRARGVHDQLARAEAASAVCEPCGKDAADPGEGLPRHRIKASACTLRARGRLDLEKFKTWICDLLWEREACVFRMKGVLFFTGDARPHVLQAVHEMWDLKAGKEGDASALAEGKDDEGDGAGTLDEKQGPVNQLVIISQSLSEAQLREEFLACFHSGDAAVDGPAAAPPAPAANSISGSETQNPASGRAGPDSLK